MNAALASNSRELNLSTMPPLRGWFHPKGSAECTNAAPMGYLPGLHWSIMTMKNVIFERHTVLKGLREAKPFNLLCPLGTLFIIVHRYLSSSVWASLGQCLSYQKVLYWEHTKCGRPRMYQSIYAMIGTQNSILLRLIQDVDQDHTSLYIYPIPFNSLSFCWNLICYREYFIPTRALFSYVTHRAWPTCWF